MEQTWQGKQGNDKQKRSNLSYWSVPEILRAVNLEDKAIGLEAPREADMKQLSSDPPLSARIEDLYGSKQVQPACNPKTRVATGQFVDWGTKLYQLQLELSYKDNEMEVLRKKVQKYSEELYPDGDQSKKSAIDVFRNKQLAAERKLTAAKHEIQAEKRRSKELSQELAQVKKRYLALRRQKLSNDKSVQTVPDNNKSTQIVTKPAIKYRTIMTQCSAAPVRPRSSNLAAVSFTSIHSHDGKQQQQHRARNDSAKSGSSLDERESAYRQMMTGRQQQSQQNTTQVQQQHGGQERIDADEAGEDKSQHHNLQYASAVTIKDNSGGGGDPLEMSLLQEFNDGGVKTVVHSNKNFKISESPMLVSRDEGVAAGVAIENVAGGDTFAASSPDCDSGVSSVRFSVETPQRNSPNPPGFNKPSYTQILNRTSPAPEPGRTYERSMPNYLNTAAQQQTPPKRQQHHRSPMPNGRFSPPKSQTRFVDHGHFGSPNSASFGRPGHPEPRGPALLPYYLFRREATGNGQIRRSEKPIFVHTSEISFSG